MSEEKKKQEVPKEEPAANPLVNTQLRTTEEFYEQKSLTEQKAKKMREDE